MSTIERLSGFDVAEKNEPLLKYYIAYRANVRAKINCLSVDNETASTAHLIDGAKKYLQIAANQLAHV